MKEIKHVLGERIRSLRNERGLSQEELGERSGLHYTYIGAVERGEKNSSVSVLEKIAGGLGVSMNDLFSFSQGRENTAQIKKWIISEVKNASPKILLLLSHMLTDLKTLESERRSSRPPRKTKVTIKK